MILPFDVTLDTGHVLRVNASDDLPVASIKQKALRRYEREFVTRRRAKVVNIEAIVAKFS